MNAVLKKMQYKGDEEIIVLNSPVEFTRHFNEISYSAKILSDYKKIKKNKKFGFILIFVKTCAEVEKYSSLAKSNLAEDGNLWFAYPKKSSKRYQVELLPGKIDISRDNGWQPLGDLGFEGVRAVAVDDDWSALRFRQAKYIKNLTRDKSWVMSSEGKTRKE